MSIEANIEASRRGVEEAFGQGKLEVLDEICSADFVNHDPLAGDQDVAASKQSIEGYRAAFPDLAMTVEDVCASGNTVCIRWKAEGTFENEFMGQSPTGERGDPTEGISIDHYDDDGKLVESWNQWDTLTFLRDVGMLPAGAQVPAG